MEQGNLPTLAAEDCTLRGQGGSDESHIAAGPLPRQTAHEPAAPSTETMRTASCGTDPRSSTRSDAPNEPGGLGLAIAKERTNCLSQLPSMTRCTGRADRMRAILPPARCPGKLRLSRLRHRPRPCTLPAVAQIPRSVPRSDAPNDPGGNGLAIPWNRGICRRWLPKIARCAGRADRMRAILPPARCPGKPRTSRPRHLPRPCALPAVAQIPAPAPDQTPRMSRAALDWRSPRKGQIAQLAVRMVSVDGAAGSCAVCLGRKGQIA